MMKCPCKSCPDVGCGEYHSQCKKYLAWKTELKKLKAAKDADANTITVPENVVREYWRSMRYTARRFNKK